MSWLCSLPPQDCSGLRLGLCSWSETGKMLPPGLGQMVQSLEQMLTARAHSLSLASCNAQRHTARPRFGPVWRSPDNHPSPDSSCTGQKHTVLWLQLCHGPPLGDVVLGCARDMSLTHTRTHAHCKIELFSAFFTRGTTV